MIRAVRAFPSMMRVGFAEMVAYRAELIVWFLTTTLPLIMLLVWDRVASTGDVDGFTRLDFARYFTMGIVVRQFTSAWIVWELNYEIRTGNLASHLLKPVHPLVYPIARTWAAIPFRFIVLVPLVGLLFAWRPDMGIGFGLAEVPALLLSLVLAWTLNYLTQAAIGCVAFFVDQSAGFWQVWFGLWSLLGGYIVPVALMPGPLAKVAWWLPFRAGYGVPVEIASGLLHGADLWAGLLSQALWTAAALALTVALWRSGVRRFEAHGS